MRTVTRTETDRVRSSRSVPSGIGNRRMQVQTSDRLRDESRPIRRNRAGANETSTVMHFTLTQSRRRTNTEPRNWNARDAPRTPTTGAKRVRNDRAEEARRDPHDTLTRAHGEMNEAQNVRDITVPPDTDTNTNANTTIKRGDRLRAHPTRAHGTTLAQWIGCPHWTWYWKVPTRKAADADAGESVTSIDVGESSAG